MSNALAIATVTATFSQLLTDVADEPGFAGTSVTTEPPDVARDNGTGKQLNIFLFRTAPNAGWRNMDLPPNTRSGEPGIPPLALDLHYLVTAYGDNNDEIDAHRVLGVAMRLVHERTVLARDDIRAAVTADTRLAGSDLAEQVELVKFSPLTLGAEELSKLWTAFQTSYRISVVYHASVVLIESTAQRRSALPVRKRMLHVAPFQSPVIEEVLPDRLEAGETLTLRGRNLRGEITKVRFGETVVDPDTIRGQELTVTLPAPLRAGVNGVQVFHEIELGVPAIPHRGTESNVMAFILQPKITTSPPISVAAGATLTLNIEPAVERLQRVALLVGEDEIRIPARPAADPPKNQLDFPIPSGLNTGSYLLRVRVDGAESALEVDAG